MKPTPFTIQQLQKVDESFPTPFYIYDEKAIRENLDKLYDAFSRNRGFKNYFAVKALPNPHILRITKEQGGGADCSSLAELILSERVGIMGEDIMFTSNNTPVEEFQKAHDLSAIINFDDISHIKFYETSVGKLPELISCRFNPGALQSGNAFIGEPVEAKFGFTKEQLFEGYRYCKQQGVKRFGIHTMVVSNELDVDHLLQTVKILFQVVQELYQQEGIEFEFVNIGGGLGIPYRPNQEPLAIEKVGIGIQKLYQEYIINAGHPETNIYMESGRYITGPYGYLITKVRHIKSTYKNYLGVDASMSNLMRPGMYDAYHHITILGRNGSEKLYDVTGSLCENNDKFAVDRNLPEDTQIGDFVVIHDAGAHAHAMGFQYNGKLRSAEFLYTPDKEFKMIRRAETVDDYFSTLEFSS